MCNSEISGFCHQEQKFKIIVKIVPDVAPVLVLVVVGVGGA